MTAKLTSVNLVKLFTETADTSEQPAKGYNATMKRAVRDHPLGIRDKLRNQRIARKRSAGERPYAVIKNIFKSGHQLVTTTLRTHTPKTCSHASVTT
ncbi:MAG: hypothetical protein Kow0019_19370 [Methanobacteriaceae archaeon]